MARSRAAAMAAGLILLLVLCCCCRRPGSGAAARLEAAAAAAAASGLSLQPPYFNLAEAAASISATATCGQDESGRPRRELYCKLVGAGPAASPAAGHTIQGQFCDYCNAADPNKAHPITNAIDGTERWWQSPSLSLGLKYDEIDVTLELGQFFHVAYILIKFANSPRPDLWVLERSLDFGRTYTAWQYFAHSKSDCWQRFRKEANARVERDDDVICTTEYSRIVPLENGEIVISLVNGRPGANTFTLSPTLREFTKATNIRLRFLRTNTLLGHLISKAQRDPTVTRRYYYSIKDISVGGQCVCHGHADVCDSKTDQTPYRYQCECQHHTCGETCDRCCPGYNQKQWQPATAGSINHCEPCNCHGHASDCYFDPEVEQRKGSLNVYGQYQGGGVCVDCQHNTAGINCEKCSKGYYRPYGVPVTVPNGCVPCSCNPEHSNGCEDGSGRCSCKLNYQGENCDRCAGYHGFPFCVGGCKPGFFGPPCQPCQCRDLGVFDGSDCDRKTGQCRCRVGFQGISCNNCAVGYFHYPFCQMCECNLAGTQPEICDFLGRCLCRREVDGPQCSSCRPGYYSFPVCQECNCDAVGSVVPTCDSQGSCLCHTNYAGPKCNHCASGYYSYPNCLPCQCSTYGSNQATCDPATGQCICLPGITGQQCDRCLSAAQSFPHCQGVSNECDPAGTRNSYSGYCQCLQNVEGPTCSICKPLYWNLARENPNGCVECQCDVTGTLSGVGECRQEDGDCYCKSNVCGVSCDTCEHGYYVLENKNYLGCQGCQCDVGGSVSHVCNELSGACQCRKHIVGKSCDNPEKNFYLPNLHQMKFEVEDGTSPNGRGIRFGFDPQEFPGFSWRGYAQMSSIQNEVRITLNVEKSSLSLVHVILRYINPGTAVVSGQITAYQSRPQKGTAQSKEIVFPPSREPAFVTVPGNSFADPFSLVPGSWIFKIRTEGVLLDYLVLLPSDYYEASLLQLPVTEPCTYSEHATTDNCLQYKHLPLDRFSCVRGSEVTFFLHGGEYRKTAFQQPTANHPVMSLISGQEVDLQIRLNVPQVGHYVTVLEYVNEHDQIYIANVNIGHVMGARVNIYSCKYRFPCRSVVVDDMNRVTVFDLWSDAKLHLRASSINFLLHKVCIIPAEEFSLEYAEPQVHCIATYGRLPDSSISCIPSQYETPPATLVLDALKDGKVSTVQRNVASQDSVLPSDHQTHGVTLTSLQNQITLNGRVTHLGRHVFVIHFYQSQNPTFAVHVLVNGGHLWSGSFDASFCPHASGCRSLVVVENQINLGIVEHDISITVKIPNGKMLVLERVLVVPADSYRYTLLHTRTVDKSFDFINQCGRNSFYINPVSSSEFCRNSARSLVAAYNNGALPCNCHRNGAVSPTCDPVGGQCDCKPHIIGLRCSRCQTGYYGFPFCKPCSCGRRLCDDVTGKCICPPQTVKPRCEVCTRQHFSYHPLAGCERCNCSRNGIVNMANPECDQIDGQCKCRPGITGQRCDRCAPGSYGFPNCEPCHCHTDGTELDVCNPQTGVCLCKENVEGIQCNTCRSGSFYLDSANPKGCTTCFCFGATNHCRSTNKCIAKFIDMKNWHLEAADNGTNIPVTFNPGSDSVVADVQELPLSVHNLYWVAPPSYLGEKLSSYGGFLSYQVKSFGLPSEGMTLLEKRPDVQLTGRQMKIIYVDPNSPLPDKQYYGSVQLVEGNFRHVSSNNNLVSREELMMVLSRLDGLRIRGLYFTESQRLTLGEVGLEVATMTGSGNVAYNVETCLCPPEYVGDSCQECSPGFYRENNGLFAGRCVQCNCNGNADRCLDNSGFCINCQHNTAGEKCEHCKEGYYGDASKGSCRPCRCPHTNSFATGCVENGGEINCFCKEGYTGRHCERCAPGYYGNPLKQGGYCQKCNCPDNGQLMNCDRLTGECISQEPKDIDPQEDCDSCDGCVITLLTDLSTMDSELLLIKSQMQGMSANAQALGQMKHIEDQVKQLQILLNRYRSIIMTHSPQVHKLETDLDDLNQTVNALKEKAETNYRKAETLFNNFGKTNQRGKDLISNIESVVLNINVLLEQIAGTSIQGTPSPFGDATLEKAQQMLREMRNRNFGQDLIKAEKEKKEAQQLLERVKNELQNHQEKNQGLIKIVRDSLNEYESKLNSLRESLSEAEEQTKQGASLNADNKILLEDTKKRIEELIKQQNNILDQLRSATATLSQTSNVFELLQRSKEEYEKLAAQLDGARKDLNEKLNIHSLSASKEPLVVKAEEHANFLQDLARQLDEIKSRASNDNLVTCAVEAATAYENIINAIKAADAAATRATNAADLALSTMQRKDLAGRAKALNTDSGKLLIQAQDARTTLQGIKPALEEVKNKLGDAESKKSVIQGELTTLQNDLQGINRDDVDSLITSAKNMVKNANDVTASVLGGLDTIKADVEKMKNSYGSTMSADLSNALTDANSSVNNLTNILPDLFNKITSINQQLMPISNVSENLNRIRELIQQARDAANKVAIPMRFNGSSGVEVRPPNILEDLKGYTSLSLYLSRLNNAPSRLDTPQPSDMFVMYLGNKDSSKGYIGMAVRDGHLICAYNLGGSETEVEVLTPVHASENKRTILDYVQFQRIYQYAALNYTKDATSTLPSSLGPYHMNSGRSHTLLNLQPDNVVFYVGGYPSDFTPPHPLNYPRYQGCIELDSLNERTISLYNFKKTYNLNTTEVEPCSRYKKQSDRYYFEGTGYAHIQPSLSGSSHLRYEQTIGTVADEGLVFFAESQDNFISLRIEKGRLVITYKVDSRQPKEESSNETNINSGATQQIQILIHKEILRVLFGKPLKPVLQIDVNAFRFSSYYLGGIPASVRERFNISTRPFRGCMLNVKTSFDSAPRFSDTLGVSKKCSDDWKLERTATLSKSGVLELSNEGFPFPSDFQVGLSFHTLALDGTLLNLRPNVLSIFLRNGFVVVRFDDKESQSSKKYEDGEMHYVTVMKEGDMLTLLVDDVPKSTEVETERRLLDQPIELGGNNFEGCISNVFIQRSNQDAQVQNLADNTKTTDVSIGFCMLKKRPQMLLLKELADIPHKMIWKKNEPLAYLTDANVQQMNKGCLSHAELNVATGAYRFGNTPGTHLLFTTSQISRNRSHFAADVQTTAPGGLVFYIGDKLGNRYMALYLSKGRYVFLLGADGRKIKIKTKGKYNDGQWHHVVFSRTERKAHLVMDGLKAREANVPLDYPTTIESPIYLGAVPSLKVQNIPRKSFMGCLRNFHIQGKLVQSHDQKHGVLPCLDNTLENGVFFFNEGGHIVLENSFSMNLDYSIIFSIRPRSATGILIHTGSKQHNYLTVYMDKGVLTASGNNGAGKFATSVTPRQSLCDGKWHFIAVTQKQNVVHLHVDTRMSNYTMGQDSDMSNNNPAQPLYFGRVPANVKASWLPVQDTFLGCLKDVKVNDKPILVSKRSDIDGVVSLQGCPVNSVPYV